MFLVGAARSGTSLLYKVLALHPDAGWISNWVQRFPALPQLVVLNGVARGLPRRRARAWFGEKGDNAYVYGRRRALAERVFPMPVEGERLFSRTGVPQPDHQLSELDARAERRLCGAFETMARWDGRRVVLNKRIANNRRIAVLARAFPEARFVEIVRDGRAVAASLARVDWWETDEVWWYGGTPRQWREEGGDPWELCARNWVEDVRVTRAGLEAVPRNKVLTLSYESLVADPRTVVDDIVRFCGLDDRVSAWRQALDRVRFPNKNERWREQLSDSSLAAIERVQRPELQRYGYLP